MSVRGAIEKCEAGSVSGWISSSDSTLRDATVLAFLDRECIGSGAVSVFRQDIADVGFGDGYAGFSISMAAIQENRHKDVYVKIAGDDTILVGSGFHGDRRAEHRLTPTEVQRQLQSIRWMRDRGWLTQAQVDLLRTVLRFGAYEMRIAEQAGGDSLLEGVRTSVAELFALFHRRELTIETVFCPDMTELKAALQQQREREQHPLAALWSAEKSHVTVTEGSHVAGEGRPAPNDASNISYEFGANRVLVIDSRVHMQSRELETQVLLFIANL